MIKSMTGFGKGTQQSPYGKITAEVKTLNHKHRSIACNPFNGFFLLEEKVKDVFAGKIHRGKVFVRISKEGPGVKKSEKTVEISEPAAKEYLRKIKRLQKKIGIKGELEIKDILSFPGVIDSSAGKNEEALWPYIKKALGKAIKKLVDYRKAEGKCLEKDFTARLKKIKSSLESIKKYGKQGVSEYRNKLVKSIQEIAQDTELDKGRLETEVALFARNCDIAEEITRLQGHLAAYKNAMSKVKTDVGKKLDFIAQEMQREANTIGSKSSNLKITKAVIEIKSEIEKMREQIKNIE